MSAPITSNSTQSSTALELRLHADLRQLSRQQRQAPPPTIDLGVTLDELAVQSDQVAIRRAELNLSSAPSPATAHAAADAAGGPPHLDTVA